MTELLLSITQTIRQ